MLDATRGPVSGSRNTGSFGYLTTGGRRCETLIFFIHMKTHTTIPNAHACMHSHSIRVNLHFSIHINRHVHTCSHKVLHWQIPNSSCKLFPLFLPYGHLYVCAARHTHTQSNSTHQKTSDSLYHHCFYFALIQNRHTWRNTNRCTQAHTQSTNLWSKIPPKQTQNNSWHFFSLSESSAASQKHQTEWSESNRNRPNPILQPHWTHKHAHKDMHVYWISFLNPQWHTIEWHTEKQNYEGKIIENDRSVLQFKVTQKQYIFWNSMVPLNKSLWLAAERQKEVWRERKTERG